MRAHVSVWTVEGDDLESVVPADVRDVGKWVRVLAGPAGADGEESFDLLVCTPAWLGRQLAEEAFIIGRHRLIVGAWNAADVRAVVTDLFERESGSDWTELAERLSRLGYWEFEDYRGRRSSA